MTILTRIYLKFIKGVPLLAFVLNFGCKKSYDPRVVSGPNNYLVVESVINTGTDSTIIRLSRAIPVSSVAKSTPETGAVISIISDANITYPVIETSPGYYKGAVINSSSPAKYSLKIFTKDGKSYQSDFVPSKNSPPIDSVYFKIQGNGIGIYADTHDPSGNSKYYRWDFNETYVFNSAFYSGYYHSKIPFDTVYQRPPSDEIYRCWRSDTSSSILISSSAKLTRDIIAGNLLTSIAAKSEKIGQRYSIEVNQYVLTPEAYNYYQQLKKNTEQLGSIFDPQPSELPGNIHCISNPSEAVIGYITAGAPSKARIFIDTRQLPGWISDNPYSGCLVDTALYKRVLTNGQIVNDVVENVYSDRELPIGPIERPGSGKILGWSESSHACVDCTLRGTNKMPSWWNDGIN
jgi:hypothetical protein